MSAYRINTNTLAMGTLRSLNMTGKEFGQSMNRLSTGLRINSAADDPAGLIVSEALRAQISGIDQALRNNQDAINYTKTAEAALDETNKLLLDARSLTIASSNTATLSDTARQANQNQLSSIINSITRIAQTTTFGTRKLLDGSAGTVAVSTSSANVKNISLSGVFNGQAITANSAITIQVTTPAERGTTAGATATFNTFSFATSTVGAGTFTINGTTFSTSAADTIADVVSRVNALSGSTGVSASWSPTNEVVLTTNDFGSDKSVNFIDSDGILLESPGTVIDAGVDAIADVTVDPDGAGSGAAVTVSFSNGSGLNLRDVYGNVISLTEAGNANASASSFGFITAGAAQFQIGANADQQTSLSLGNFASSELGKGVVSNKNLGNIGLLNANDARDALQVIDKAIEDISVARGNIGNFSRNVLESNVRSLGVQRENLSATESSIRDVDVAAEMTTFTRFQILQQSGLAMLAQANQAPQGVLSLLR